MGTGSAKAFAHTEQGGGFEAIRPGTSQTVVINSNSTSVSTAFTGKTTIVRLFSTVDCYLAFGATPTVTGSSCFLPGGIIDYLGVDGGTKIATLWSATSGAGNQGVLFICEGA